MRLVLLPGLNGSSSLFAPLLSSLKEFPTQVLPLPNQGPQDYDSLTTAIAEQLGDSSFVLLGESFSGPLAYRLALRRPQGLRGMIFAASFLTRPHPLLPLSAYLPLPKGLLSLDWLLQLLCLDRQADTALLDLLREEIRQLPPALLRARLHSLAQLGEPSQRLELPALHLKAQKDRLVTRQASASIERHCDQLQQYAIDGPHFLLQSRPQACAHAINRFMAELANT